MYGQFVIGAPGSGKTTYCSALAAILNRIKRKTIVVNLDPANESSEIAFDIDIRDLVRVEDVMTHIHLGPNGSIVYCLEYLEKNIEWLFGRLEQCISCYVLFDCPGQIELYVHHKVMQNILEKITSFNNLSLHLTAVNLVDSHHCNDAGKYISVLLTSLCSMLHLALPHVNVLSKVDVIEKFGSLDFHLDFYTDVLDLKYLVDTIKNDRFLSRYGSLSEALANTVEDYGLVSFFPLSIQKLDLIIEVLQACDKANGYSLSEDSQSVAGLLSAALGETEKQA